MKPVIHTTFLLLLLLSIEAFAQERTCLTDELAAFSSLSGREPFPPEDFVASLWDTITCLESIHKDYELSPEEGGPFWQEIRSFVKGAYQTDEFITRVSCSNRHNRYGDWIRCEGRNWFCEEIVGTTRTRCRVLGVTSGT